MSRACATCRAIAIAARDVARQAHDHSARHRHAVLRIIQYLRGTQEKAIVHKKKVSWQQGRRRPVSGGVMLFRGGAVS